MTSPSPLRLPMKVHRVLQPMPRRRGSSTVLGAGTLRPAARLPLAAPLLQSGTTTRLHRAAGEIAGRRVAVASLVCRPSSWPAMSHDGGSRRMIQCTRSVGAYSKELAQRLEGHRLGWVACGDPGVQKPGRRLRATVAAGPAVTGQPLPTPPGLLHAICQAGTPTVQAGTGPPDPGGPARWECWGLEQSISTPTTPCCATHPDCSEPSCGHVDQA